MGRIVPISLFQKTPNSSEFQGFQQVLQQNLDTPRQAIRQAQARAIDALETLAIRHPNQRVAVVSHSDVIKLIVAHYLGAHIDLFQRIEISPASLTILRLGADRPNIIRVNDTSYLPVIERPPSPPRPSIWRRLWRLIEARSR